MNDLLLSIYARKVMSTTAIDNIQEGKYGTFLIMESDILRNRNLELDLIAVVSLRAGH